MPTDTNTESSLGEVINAIAVDGGLGSRPRQAVVAVVAAVGNEIGGLRRDCRGLKKA